MPDIATIESLGIIVIAIGMAVVIWRAVHCEQSSKGLGGDGGGNGSAGDDGGDCGGD